MKPEHLMEYKKLVGEKKLDYDTNDTPETIERKYKDYKIIEAIKKFQDASDRR